jgi:hypothetical protein
MARRAAAKNVDVTPASAQEVRAWLLEQSELPEGVTVASRGRLSSAARAHFTEATGRPIAEREVAAAE